MHILLLIDDNEVILHLYSKVLEKAGYSVETSNNPLEAINLFKKKIFHLVITDYEMLINNQEINGYYVKTEIKNISLKTPVILMTGGSNRHFNIEEDFNNMIEEKMFFIKNYGFDDYINKCWSNPQEELVLSVNRLLKK